MPDYILKLGNKSIELPAPLNQSMDVGKLTVVRVYPTDEMLNNYPQEEFNRNVYAYDLSGNLVWQIQEALHSGSGEDKAYMDIRFSDGKLIAGNWIGVDYLVNLVNGKVSPAQRGVRPW